MHCDDCDDTGHAEGCESRQPAYDLGDLICRYPCKGCCPKGCEPTSEQDAASRKIHALLGVER